MIQSPRLDLVPATLALVTADLHERDRLPALLDAAIGSGWPPPLMNVEAMQRMKEALSTNVPHEGWTAYYVVERSGRVLIGIGGFKAKPRDGAVEMGYSLLPLFQQQGLGTELVGALATWAFTHPELKVLFAETLPELIASQRVLEKNGFTRGGEPSEPGVIRFERRREHAGAGKWDADAG
jgi:ribosomal-protein-alanine N-acetyltransferase